MKAKQLFRSTLLRWYRTHGREDLPWRRTADPYAILVSEFMLQQTQVQSVLPYYRSWLRRFPDFRALARASENDVLHAWQGLGYYARARNLHAAAKIISGKSDGQCPQTEDELRSLPGIGRYTANAILSFAFDRSVPIVDANIGRVLARLYNIRTPIDSALGQESIWQAAAQLVGPRGSRVFNSALMDLGAIVCVARFPKCDICPVKTFCLAKAPARLPVKKRPLRTKRLTEQHGFSIRNGRLLLQQSTRRWRGMWILPPLPTAPRENPIHRSVFPFTNHRIRLDIYRSKLTSTPGRDDICVGPEIMGRDEARPSPVSHAKQRWIQISQLNSIPIPSPHRRAIATLVARREFLN